MVAKKESKLEHAAEQARHKAAVSQFQPAREQGTDHAGQQARASEERAALAADLESHGMKLKCVQPNGRCWWLSASVSLTVATRATTTKAFRWAADRARVKCSDRSMSQLLDTATDLWTGDAKPDDIAAWANNAEAVLHGHVRACRRA